MKTNDVISVLIEGEKYIEEKVGCSDQLSDDWSLFCRGVIDLYNYMAGRNKQKKKSYSKSDFVEIFYSAVADGKEIPDDIYFWAQRYCKGIHYESADSTTLANLKKRVVQLRAARIIHDRSVQENEVETSEIRKLIFNYCHMPGYMALIRPLLTWARIHNRLDAKFVAAMFQYGYIMGKRAERSRRAVKKSGEEKRKLSAIP